MASNSPQIHSGEGYLSGLSFASPATKKWAEAKVGKPSLYNYESRSSRYASLVLSKHFGTGAASSSSFGSNSNSYPSASSPSRQPIAPVAESSSSFGGIALETSRVSDGSNVSIGETGTTTAGTSMSLLSPTQAADDCPSPASSLQNDPSLRKYHRRWTNQPAALSPHAAEKLRHAERKVKAEAAVTEVLARGHRNVQTEFKLAQVLHAEEKAREEVLYKLEPTGRREIYGGFYASLLGALCDEEVSKRSRIEVDAVKYRETGQGGRYFSEIQLALSQMVLEQQQEKEDLGESEASARILIEKDAFSPEKEAEFQQKRDELDDMFTELENDRTRENFIVAEADERREVSSTEVIERAALVLHLQALILDLRKAQSHHLMEVVEGAKAMVPGGQIWKRIKEDEGDASEDISPVPSGGFPAYEDSFNFSVSLNGSAKDQL